LDVRDLWPESAIEVVNTKKSIVYNILIILVKWMYCESELITVISKIMKNTIVKDYDIDKNRIYVVHNFSNIKNSILENKNNDKIKISYTGILTDAQDIYNLIKYSNNKNIEWHIAGIGDQFNKIKELNFLNVFLYGYKDKVFCDELIISSDICLVPLKESKLFEMAIPSKFFEYISLNKPILFNTSLELKELNDEYNFGWYVDNPTQENIENVINSITLEDIKIKSQNAYKLFEEKFEQSIVCEQLHQIIKSIV
jgi:hypothetical protein